MTDILDIAARRNGMRYRLDPPPDGVETIDCSLFTILTARDAGRPLPPNVRTAEEIRQAVPSVSLALVEPGDFLFFANTYDSGHKPGPDGLVATHVGISLGRGTQKMWDANDVRGSVGITSIRPDWWQDRLIGAGRLPGLDAEAPRSQPIATGPQLRLTASGVRLRAAPSTAAPILVEDLGLDTIVTATSPYDWREVVTGDGKPGWVAAQYLSPATAAATAPWQDVEPDRQFTLAQLWPDIQDAANTYGADPRVMAGIIEQESAWRNWRVHHDGTGHGLTGLDDNGLLPDFEQWSHTRVGRGQSASTIPPGIQITYLAKTLATYASQFGDPYKAARAWHRGEKLMNDSAGVNYERLIRAHVARLFG